MDSVAYRLSFSIMDIYKKNFLEGRTAVVTGASGGIGAATVTALERFGAVVVRHTGRTQADFSITGEADRFVDSVLEHSPKIDIWVNAAGVDLMSPEMKCLTFDQRLRHLMEVDVFAVVNMSQRIGRRLKEHGGGTLVFFGWDGVTYGLTGETAQLYGSAKGAILGFCRSLAATLAPEVRVRCLSPGWIQTRWGTHISEEFQRFGEDDSLRGRWGTPSEVADAVLFLVSPLSDFVDGIDIRLNGGKRPLSFTCRD